MSHLRRLAAELVNMLGVKQLGHWPYTAGEIGGAIFDPYGELQ